MKVMDVKHKTVHVVILFGDLGTRFKAGESINSLVRSSRYWSKIGKCQGTTCDCGNIVEVLSCNGKNHTEESLREQMVRSDSETLAARKKLVEESMRLVAKRKCQDF